ncbi:phosphoribosylformimino-5-aminoimidazole carboxamide ribotide isomerase [bacterium]|nr:phosphoribosylformimino-5-aminoimidazole carboxamide ribotide isomerase [bacterium]
MSNLKSLFRPCIDLHEGQVKQIVGGTLTDAGAKENFVSGHPSSHFANMFRDDQLQGGHVIQLGPGNQSAAEEAIAAYPNGLQIGGGINDTNAKKWIESGASHIIVTSWLFNDKAELQEQRAETLANVVSPQRLVIDLSCRKTDEGWSVAMNRWQTLTDVVLNHATLQRLSPYCDEFLIHAADVEGKCRGIDLELVEMLGRWTGKKVVYAGGVADMSDLESIQTLSKGRVDVTVGSALDIFGGSGVGYRELVAWNRRS